MKVLDYNDINYEDLDDLPVQDHIEWNQQTGEEFSLDDMDQRHLFDD
jgi:hypothetical protein